jgi:putative GTP pyrophosphokinase
MTEENVVPLVPSKQDAEEILIEFDSRQETLKLLCDRTKQLIEASLADAQIKFQQVQHRVKGRKKLQEKYTDPAKSYKCLDDITDLAAFRVITYYDDEVDAVANVIRKEFNVDEANTSDKRKSDPDKFSYYAINIVCGHTAERLKSVEYKKYSGHRFEIQITSILRHAWSEIEHDWYDLKKAFPATIKRRFARMAALLEIAESEFQALRKEKGNYTKSVKLQVETQVANIPLGLVSIQSFIEQEQLVEKIDKLIAKNHKGGDVDIKPRSVAFASDLASNVLRLTDIKTIDELRSALEKNEAAVIAFAAGCERLISIFHKGSPVTKGMSTIFLGLFLLASSGVGKLKPGLQKVGWTAYDAEAEKFVELANDVQQRQLGKGKTGKKD